LGEVEEHCRVAAHGNDPPGRRIRLEPALFKIFLPNRASHPILSVQDNVCSTVRIEHGWRRSQLLELASGFLAACAVTGASQNRRPDSLELNLAALACRKEIFLLFLLHCTFLGLIRKSILSAE
jgi:hypothetical protein